MTNSAQSMPILPKGIEKMALSFSGGGFRAAAFTLGCTSYLNHLHYKGEPLLHKVKFISSASGGTITNLILCSMLREGFSFQEIYDFQKKQMSGCYLMDEVFKLLEDAAAWESRPDKSKNLINAFALAYDKLLFNKATFQSLHQTPKKEGFVIAETCINATEFDNGMNFRWGTSGDLGNKYLHFQPKRRAADKVKLGDILASSSCFPGGFEPIMFPRDFSYDEDNEKLTIQELNHDIVEKNYYNGKETTASKNNEEITFGFMDGGIDDNQGIYAFELADSRKLGHYDLYFPCDVSSNFLAGPFIYPKTSVQPALKQTWAQIWTKIKAGITGYFMCFIAILIVAGVLVVFQHTRPIGLVLDGISFTAIALPLIVYWIADKWFKKTKKSLLPDSPSSDSWRLIFDKYKNSLLKLPLNTLLTMLIARASSVLLLATDVYLKRIRQISYKLLYADKANDVYRQLINDNNTQPKPGIITPGGLWKQRIGVTTVYLLSKKNDFMLKKILEQDNIKEQPVSATDNMKLYQLLYPVPAALQQVADIATKMATTLWFDGNQVKNESMKKLITTGQATMCYNLILMAYQFGNTDKDWIALKESLISDWKEFKKNPYFMYGNV